MNLLSLEDEKFKDVTVKGYNFKIRYMTPLDRVQIAQHRMRLQGGNPVEALTDNDFIFFENIAVVDTCLDDSPKEFENHESCLKWQDIDLINELSVAIRKHTNEIESKLKKNRPVVGGE